MLAAATTPPRFATLVALTALTTLTLNMFLPSLAGMAQHFGVDYAAISFAISGYLAVTAGLQLIIGPLSDRFGRRPVILVSLAIFLAASLVCATTDDVEIFLAFRLLQGAIVAGWGISLSVVRDTFGPRDAASRLGFLSMAMSVMPMTGPLVGGVLDETFGWRANFLFYAGVAGVLLIVCWADMGETNRNKSRSFLSQFRTYPTVLGSRRFWGFACCTAFSVGAFFAFLAGVPLVAVAHFGMSPSVLGICMGSITGGFLFGSFLSGRFSSRFPLAMMMVAGRLVACSGLTIGLVLVLSGTVDPVLYFAATICVGIGNGITNPSSNAGVMSVNPSLAGSAAGLSGAMTVGTGAVMSTLAGILLTPQNAAAGLLALMLGATVVSLLAALVVMRAGPIEEAA